MKKLLLCSLVISLNICALHAQDPTIGLQFHDASVSDGYTLFTPSANNSVYLINNCGEVLNEWTFNERPGATCYILENGNLLRAGRQGIETRDWENNVVWSFSMESIGLNQHHDIEPLPNGNVLCVITDTYTDAEMIAMGRNPSILDPEFKLDKIIELEPDGATGANIVWEWKFIDHFIQDFDAAKANYGVVEDHPELLDLNFDNGFNFDWTHVNAIDYNADLDQIIISPRHLSEIYIIDHSTTTAEAAGHTGGNSGMGGDLLWRWGNPQVYRQGDTSDQKVFKQHDTKWVENGYLDEGKISIFNNGGDGTDTFSSVHLIEPNIVGGVYTKIDDKFAPVDYDWSWNGSILGETVLENSRSGGHSLPNGNFIFCESSKGRFSEVAKDGTHLWTYRNPTYDTGIYNQFDEPTGNALFRGEKYPTDYVGFTGRDLTPSSIIENVNGLSDTCINGLSVSNNDLESLTLINPVSNGAIQFNKAISLNAITIADVNGRIVYSIGAFSGNTLNTELLPALYFVKLQFEDAIETRKIIVK